jgi:two-component system, cell cycle sensor histidine kinase and response regulator CckA
MAASRRTSSGRRLRSAGRPAATFAIVAGLALAVLGAVLVFALVYAPAERAQAVEGWEARLDAMADDRRAAIAAWVESGIADAATVAAFPTVISSAQGRQGSGGMAPSPPRAHLQDVIDGFTEANRQRAVVVLDAKGAVIVRSTGRTRPGGECTEAVASLAAGGEPFADFCRGPGGQPLVVFGAPIVGPAPARGGRRPTLGAAVVAADPEVWLYPFLAREPLPTASGEVTLARSDGGGVVYLSPLRHGAIHPLTFRLTTDVPSLAARAAVQGKEGFATLADYHGRTVFAATRSIPGTPWGLVAKVDCEEALAPYRARIRSSALTLLGFGLAVVGTGFGLWRARQARYEAALAQSGARFALLLDHANDAIFFVALDGRILHANSRAEALYGYAREELLRTNLRELRAEETRDTLPEHIARAAAPGGLVLQTVHQRKDGSRFPVEFSSRLAEFAGERALLSIIRDLSEREAAEELRKQAETALRESEERFRALIEKSGDLVVVVDRTGAITFAGPSSIEVLGFPPEELVGASVFALVHPDDLEKLKGLFDDVGGRPGLTRRLEMRARHRNGSWHVFDAVVRDLSHVRGVRGLVMNVRDITERKLAESAVRESEERYRVLVDNLQDVVVTFSLDGTMTSFNSAFERITGWPPEQWMGRPFADLIHPDDLEAALGYFARVLRQESPGLFEVRVRAHDGSWLNAEFTGGALVEDGALVGAQGTGRDVTQRRRAEERLRLQAQVLDQVHEAVISTDLDGYITSWNHGAERLFGYDAGEALGRYIGMLYPEEGLAALEEEIIGALKQTGTHETEVRVLGKGGTPFWVHLGLSLLRDGDGRPVGMIGYSLDMTEHRRLEDELRQVQKMEAIGRLAGGVAHDFNNLLQAMLSQAQVVRAAPDDPERVAATAGELEQQIRRGAALSRQLLLFSKRETAKRERLDLNDVVGGATQLLRRLVRENITFSVELSRQPLPVLADRGQLDQVLMNLVVNASDAMPGGGQLAVRTGEAGGDRVWLSVEDTGSGVPEAIRDRIFEPFFTTKPGERGSGLGLSVVHGIVTKHGGTIRLADRDRGGTVFRIELPRAAGNARSPGPAAPAEDCPRGNGERVLVVEDEPGARDGLAGLLEMLGYRVTAVGSAEEATRLPTDPAFDVVLSDLLLPDASGAELTPVLAVRWPRLKVILMSGYTEDDAVRGAVAANAVRFLQKPFDMRTLAREIRTALAARPVAG